MSRESVLTEPDTETAVIDRVNRDGSAPAGTRNRGSADYRNLSPASLVEHAIRRGEGRLANSGALAVETGVHTGRSPKDKFLVRSGRMADAIWWGDVNQPMAPEAFSALHADIVEHLARADRYRMDLSAGANPDFNLPVRLVTESAWSANDWAACWSRIAAA